MLERARQQGLDFLIQDLYHESKSVRYLSEKTGVPFTTLPHDVGAVPEATDLVLNEVAQSKEPVVITKRGKPLAQVIGFRKSEMKPMPGKLADAFVFETDIVTPLDEGLWEAGQ